jgi:methyl-accepting chemotaxis protein
MVAHTTLVRSRIADMGTVARQSSDALHQVESATDEVRGVIDAVIAQTDHAVSATACALGDVHRSDVLFANLSQHAEEIGSILDVIGALAGQSRLLALNATIEAARAGDAGHPFRVVAQEVKSLSHRIACATVAIADRIAGVRSAVVEVVAANGAVNGRLNDIHVRAGSIRGSAAATLTHVDTVMQVMDELTRITTHAGERFRQLDDGDRRLAESLGEVTLQFDRVGGSVATLVAGAERFWADHLDPGQPGPEPIRAVA